MGKKKIEPKEEFDDWLVGYADMMTLIACFFILMMATAPIITLWTMTTHRAGSGY